MTERRRSGCWKIGCCGCCVPVVAIVLLMAVVALSELSRGSTDRRQESRDLERQLPALPSLEELMASGELLAQPLELGDFQTAFNGSDLASKVGRVVLDLHVGDFSIRAGEAGEPIRVDANFEGDAFELREDFTEDPAGGFAYQISFKPKGGMAGMVFRGAGNNPRNKLEIVLPRDRPLDLVGELGLGQAQVDLGGLWLRTVDLEIGAGEHTIELTEPLLMPMSSFRIAAKAGELQLRGLGYASPQDVSVEMSVGELLLDLSGQPWQASSRVRLDFGFGDARVRLPVGARVEVERGKVSIGESNLRQPSNEGIAAGAPTVTLDLKAKVGELTLEPSSI